MLLPFLSCIRNISLSPNNENIVHFFPSSFIDLPFTFAFDTPDFSFCIVYEVWGSLYFSWISNYCTTIIWKQFIFHWVVVQSFPFGFIVLWIYLCTNAVVWIIMHYKTLQLRQTPVLQDFFFLQTFLYYPIFFEFLCKY